MANTTRILLVAAGLALPMTLPAQGMVTSADSARHVLQRLAWGPAPGQVEQVAAQGVMNWVEAQLRLPAVADPSRMAKESELAALTTPTSALIRDDADRRRALLAASRDSMRPPAAGPRQENLVRQVNLEYAAVTLSRQAASNHQLGEVLADFWSNHFNVFINKGLDRVLLRDHVERAIRPNALRKFEDLLLATAQSPAMLFYLDNVQSVAARSDPAPPSGRRPRRVSQDQREALRARMPRGINENYARELLELHTLGVDGGYTQDDVVNVARLLTGWGIDRRDGSFQFNDAAHDREAKVVLGVQFGAGGGRDEGERLLRMLANHPATMHHLSAKLCARLVADEPPDGCIDDAVRAWRQSGGEIVAVVRAIVTGPDFWASAHRDAKIKSPHEFVISALRALDAELVRPAPIVAQLNTLGHGLFQQSAPTGWPESQQEWVNSGALLARMNFAVALAGGRMAGVRVDLDHVAQLTRDHVEMLDAIDRRLLAGAMSATTRAAIMAELADLTDPMAARAMAVGLAIGGPDFQRQ